MDNKTAMMQLKSIVQSMIENGGDLGEDYPALMQHIENHIPKERQQIEEAYMDSTLQFDNASPIINPKTPSEYYNQTYTQNNH